MLRSQLPAPRKAPSGSIREELNTLPADAVPRTDKSAGIPAEYQGYSINPETLKINDAIDRISNLPFDRKVLPIRLKTVVLARGDSEGKPPKPSVTISSSKQKEFLTALLTKTDIVGQSTRILIASDKTDKVPMIIAACVARHLLARGIKVKFVNTFFSSGKISFKESREFEHGKYGLVVVTGVFSGSTDYKIQDVRDFISSVTWPCPVILVAGGLEDPVKFYERRLNLSMDATLYVSSSTQV